MNVTAWRESYEHLLSAQFLASLSIGERVESWRRGLARDPRSTVVADVDGEVRGYATAGIPRSEE